MTESRSPENPPYLTLTISQALSLPPPAAPEPPHHDSVNHMLDNRARHMPDQLAVGFTSLSSGTWGCRTLTYAQVTSLAVGLAGALQPRLPRREKNAKSPNGTPLVAVLSPSGLELFGHIVALWRMGWGVLCVAPGSPAESIANLLKLTETKAVLAHRSQIEAIQAAVDVVRGDKLHAEVCEMLPDISPYINSDTHTDSAQKSVEAGSDDVLVTMHTSGSSGLPKPIYQLHRFWTASLLTAPGRTLSAFTTTPLFHGGMSDLLRSIQAGSSIFFHPTADPGALSASAIVQAVAACGVEIAYFLSVPYILDMLFTDRSDEARRMLARMQLVSTGGAPLPQQLGDEMVEAGIRLVSRLGSSECGFLMSSWRDFTVDPNWNLLRIPDELGQRMIRFEPHDPTSPLFELVVTKDWPTKLISNRDDDSYATSDLYSQHGANTWRYDSRADDTIVLVSGKKASAPVAEQKLKASPLVSEAIVFGANRAILGALVFVSPESVPEGTSFDDAVKVKLLKQLQPVLKEINAASPPHAQLASEMVHLLAPAEAADIPRASKGSLQRGRAYQRYADLIDTIYLDFEEGRSLRLQSPTTNGNAAKAKLSGTELIDWLQATVEAINGRSVSADADLFVAGVDSIQSARIRAAVHQNIELGGRLLERNVVYEYPTLRLLAEHVEGVQSGAGGQGADERQERELKLMRELVEKYSQPPPRLSKPAVGSEGGDAKGTLYILTGVTGGLGAQLLSQLLTTRQDDDTILCLVRADTPDVARKRVHTSLATRRLTPDHFDSLHCLPADLSLPDCGLAPPSVNCARVVTIHSAWSVNFVASLSSFEPQNIAGLSNLITLHQSLLPSLSEEGRRWSCFTFCSSVASVLDCSPGTVLAETLSTSPEEAVAMGYARSKWVAEQIVSRRFESGYRIVRIGQLCSDTANGVWNENEAWPLLICLSHQLGMFPDINETLDWVATDVAATTLLNISSSGDGVYNVAQPTTISPAAARWKDLHTWLTASGLTFPLVRPQTWLEGVQQSNVDHRGLLPLWQKNFTSPAPAKQTRFDCSRSLAASERFRTWQTQGVSQELIQKTVARWKEIAFLP